MKKWVVMAGMLFGVLVAAAAGQTPVPGAVEAGTPVGPAPVGEVLRQIDDPAANGIWLLVRDPEHQAGPGRLIWVPRGASPALHSTDTVAAPAPKQVLKPVIFTGDQLVVEEETSVVDARLAATALNPAPVGAPLHVRLEVGGKVVRAIAVAPGLARLAPELEIEP